MSEATRAIALKHATDLAVARIGDGSTVNVDTLLADAEAMHQFVQADAGAPPKVSAPTADPPPPAPPAKKPAPKPEKKVEAPKPAPEKKPEPAQEPETSKADKVRAVFADMLKRNLRAEAVALLKKHNAGSVKGLAEESYDEVLAEAEEILLVD